MTVLYSYILWSATSSDELRRFTVCKVVTRNVEAVNRKKLTCVHGNIHRHTQTNSKKFLRFKFQCSTKCLNYAFTDGSAVW